MTLVVLDFLELNDADWQRLRERTAVIAYDTIPQTPADILTRLKDAEGVVTSVTPLDAEILHQLPHLRYILVPGVGMDHIDLEAAQVKGIKVMNCPTYNANAVAELTIGLMLAIARHLTLAHHAVQAGQWDPRSLIGTELSGQHLVVIGSGTIGRSVVQKSEALGMQVSVARSQTSPTELDQLMTTADFLSFHIPLTAATHHLLDARRLALMKPTAYVINTARGGVIDSVALLHALQSRQIAGAALDVFEGEPTTGHPSATIMAFAQLDNVIATPHMAYNTDAAIQRLGQELIEQWDRWRGEGAIAP